MDNEEDFERLDFPISDLSSSAPWVEAAQEQLRRRDARSGQTRALLQKLQGQGRDAQADNSSSAAAANGGNSSNSGNSSPGDIQKAMGNAVRGGVAGACECGGSRTGDPLHHLCVTHHSIASPLCDPSHTVLLQEPPPLRSFLTTVRP